MPKHTIRIANIGVGEIVPSKDNPNYMSPDEYDLLVANIKETGFLQPLLVQEEPASGGGYALIDGHHRYKAAVELGMKSVACVITDADSDYVDVLRISMNKLRGEQDLTGVGRIVDRLFKKGWLPEDLEITGFNTDEIGDLLKSMNQTTNALPAEMQLPSADDYSTDEVDDREAKVFRLELEFSTLEEVKAVKRALKRAGGKDKDMALGLLKLLGEEREKTA